MAKAIVKADLNQASSNGASFPSFEPDILASHQYLKTCQRAHPVEPEKALMLAVLAEALDTYQRFAFSQSPRGRLLFREAKAWFRHERPTDSIFAFRSICEVFGLNPDFLRRGLMQWTANRERTQSPRIKIQLHLERSRARGPLNNIGKKLSNYGNKVRAPTALNQHLVSPLD
jgi:hypothetical protein